VYSWYREFSMHDQLADEIRYVIRYAASVLLARLQDVRIGDTNYLDVYFFEINLN